MALSIGDIITYDGSVWKNQQWVQALGIGTSGAPTATLEVNGNVTISGTQRTLNMSSSGDAIFQRAGTTFMRFMSDNSAVQFDIGSIRGANNANLTLFAAGTGDLLLQTDSDSDVNIGSGQLFVRGSDGKVGIGTTDPFCRLHINGGIATNVTDTGSMTGNYTVQDNDSIVVARNHSGSTKDVILPQASTTNKGRLITVKRVDTGDTVAVKGSGTGWMIDNNTTGVLLNAQHEFITVVSFGSGNQWYIVARELAL